MVSQQKTGVNKRAFFGGVPVLATDRLAMVRWEHTRSKCVDLNTEKEHVDSMGLYLNPGNEAFRQAVTDDIYIDKTRMIALMNQKLNKFRRQSLRIYGQNMEIALKWILMGCPVF